MVQIEFCSRPQGQLPLWEMVEARVHREDPRIETRCFFEQQGVFYPVPFIDWSSTDTLWLFLEAPGHYSLRLEWRLSDQASGWIEKKFDAVYKRPMPDRPCRIRVDSRTQVWAPSTWEAKVLEHTEMKTRAILERMIARGMVIYDLGANFGIYSFQMARSTGQSGHVYSLEPNPVCVQFLKTGLSQNKLANMEILPVAALDVTGRTSFKINYGNANLGFAKETIQDSPKLGYELEVPCWELDRLIPAFGLREPQLIKIDVEGSETRALRGMLRTLERERPNLLMELHGEKNAAQSLALLEPLRYRFVDPSTMAELRSVDRVRETFGDTVFQLACVAPDARTNLEATK